MVVIETQQANVSPMAGLHLKGLPGQSEWKGKAVCTANDLSQI